MKKIVVLLTCLLATSLWATAQEKKRGGLGGWLDRANEALKSGNPGQDEIARGLKEALTIGIKNGAGQASARDGYWGNQLLRIAVPPEVKRAETTLRQVGLGKEVDRFLLAMNRGAEDAAKQAVPIFVNAIRQMTIQDAVGVLSGEKDAATKYLKRTASPELVKAFTPVIDSSLAQTNATHYYADLARTYNQLPLVQQRINPDLTGYVTQRAIDGLFVLVAQEEARIRENPQARVTDLLRRVFGSPNAVSGASTPAPGQ